MIICLFGPTFPEADKLLRLLGGFLMLCVGVLYLMFDRRITAPSNGQAIPSTTISWSRCILGVQVGLILLAMIVTRSSIASLQTRKGLPAGNQVVGWAVLGRGSRSLCSSSRANANAVTSLSTPFLHRLYPNKHYLHRLVVIFLTFSPTFIILTISYEGLFYFAFCITLVAWVRLEHHIYTLTTYDEASPNSPPPTPKPLGDAIASVAAQIKSSDEGDSQHGYRALKLSDARISLFFFFFLQSAFFSTGNIASISSFSLESVCRLLPVFDPFSQGALLMLKIMIPFAVISANLGILNRRLGVAPSALFMVVMAVSDVLTLSFFWMVRDEGSWLDIGTSISHFSIASLLCAFVAMLEFVSEVFVSGVDVGESESGVAQKSNGTANGGANHANRRAVPESVAKIDAGPLNAH